jgi:hypothetical protein
LPGTKATDEEVNRGIGRAKPAETSANGTLTEFEGPEDNLSCKTHLSFSGDHSQVLA